MARPQVGMTRPAGCLAVARNSEERERGGLVPVASLASAVLDPRMILLLLPLAGSLQALAPLLTVAVPPETRVNCRTVAQG